MAKNILQDQIDLKQTTSHTYSASYHADWSLGRTLHGGAVAAVIHHAASTHLSTTLAAKDQPDILALHYDFLRPCELCDSLITVSDLKLGAATSTLRLELSQNGKLRVAAQATATNFDKLAGPTVASAWALHPPPAPVPDFAKILAHQPDEHWLPAVVDGEVLPFTRRQLVLNSGFPTAGVCDAWNTFQRGAERMDATYLALMADCVPSLSDTLVHNHGLYDARRNFEKIRAAARANPGQPAVLTNSYRELAASSVFNNTVTLDIEFKRRLPREGVRWTFTRAATRMLEAGRMDLDITICNEKMEYLCLARQVVLALDVSRKLGVEGGGVKAKAAL
ncbi:hypothetical protein PG984_002519 [Apiospora sp. TS-2023a]